MKYKIHFSYLILTATVSNAQYYKQPSLDPMTCQNSLIGITNCTSAQSIVTIQTDDGQTLQQTALPNELMGNQILGNEVISSTPIYPIFYGTKNLNTPTLINYTASNIRKITVTRLSTNMPQIIYYVDGDTSPDQNSNAGGIYAINTTGQGTMVIWKDYLMINHTKYPVADLSSFMAKINMLTQNLTAGSSATIKNDLVDLQNSLQLIKKSDMYSQVMTQVTVIEGALYELKHTLDMYTNFTKAINTIQDLEKNLTVDNVDATQQQLAIYQQGTKTFQLSNLQNQSIEQAQALQSSILSLQNAIRDMQTSANSANRKVLSFSKVDELDAMSMGNPPPLP